MEKRAVLIFVGFIITLMMSGCLELERSPEALRPPTFTKIVMDSTSITLYWDPSPDSASEDFLGYNLYCTTDSTIYKLKGDAEDLENYKKGDTAETFFEITELSQDSIYFIHIRTVSGTEENYIIGNASNQLQGSPRPEWTVTLMMKLYPGEDTACAVKFSTGERMSDKDMASKGADMWVNWIFPNTSLNSPHKSEEFGAGADITLFVNLGKKEFDEVWKVETEPDKESVTVNEGDLVIAKTQDNHYVKVHIDELPDFSVTITYGYQNLKDYPYFAPKHP